MPKTLYHTIRKDRIVAASVKNAPYRCVNNAWLGEGYYFWDSFIDLAHWWGESHYGGNYIITETGLAIKEDEVFDLVGNTDHIADFADYAEAMIQKKGDEVTVPEVIEHMKRHTRLLESFKAIRADGRLSIARFSPYTNRLKFSLAKGHPQYLDLFPSIQYCLFEKTDVNQPTIAFISGK